MKAFLLSLILSAPIMAQEEHCLFLCPLANSVDGLSLSTCLLSGDRTQALACNYEGSQTTQNICSTCPTDDEVGNGFWFKRKSIDFAPQSGDCNLSCTYLNDGSLTDDQGLISRTEIFEQIKRWAFIKKIKLRNDIEVCFATRCQKFKLAGNGDYAKFSFDKRPTDFNFVLGSSRLARALNGLRCGSGEGGIVRLGTMLFKADTYEVGELNIQIGPSVGNS